jgi:predicted permease
VDELRLALRRLLKRPASTLASIATLACAIGAAAVTWSALSAVLINPLPVRDADHLLVVGTQVQRRTGPGVVTTHLYPKYQQIKETGAFEQVTAQWGSTFLLLVNAGDAPARVDVGFAMHDFFDVLGVGVVLGRGFSPEDDRRGATPVAVLTDRYWRTTFKGDPAVLGRSIDVAGKRATIVGVLQRGFRGLNLAAKADLYLPFHTVGDVGDPTGNPFADPKPGYSPTAGTMILGRLRAGAAHAEAVSRIAATNPPPPPGRTANPVVLVPANEAAIPAAARPGMVRFSRLLVATVALLLVIGCTTVGMLLLIRTEARREEFAMCMALGASRARLARGIAFEGAMLALAGSVLALPVAWWLFGLIRVFQLPGNISVDLLELSLDSRVLAATMLAATAAVLLIALVAGVFGFRADVADALRARAGAAPLQRRATRAVLVAAQVAVAVTLVAGAGLFARSLIAALSLNPGLDMSRTVLTTVSLRAHGYTPERATPFFEALRARLESSPAIDSVSLRTWEGGMSPSGEITVDGIARQFPSLVSYIRVDEPFFPTLNIRIVEGRNFSADDRPGSPPVAIVTESFGRMLAGGGSPLGKRLGGISAAIVPMEVVGVVSDTITNVEVLEPLVLYLPASQGTPALVRDVAARAAGRVEDAQRAIMTAVREVDPNVIPTAPRTLEERMADQMGPQRLGATVLGALGAIAVLLTLLGTYVMAESMASARMKEMGIRAALGATRRQLGSIVLTDTLRLAGLGIAAGLALSWLGTSTIRSFLFQVEPFDPATIGSVAALILVLALAVSLRAALRVARVDLAQVLRNE